MGGQEMSIFIIIIKNIDTSRRACYNLAGWKQHINGIE